MPLPDLIKTLAARIKRVNLRIERLERENAELRQSVFNYLNELNEHKKEVAELKSALNTKKMAKLNFEEKRDIQKELDKYINIIDKCMATMKVDSIKSSS